MQGMCRRLISAGRQANYRGVGRSIFGRFSVDFQGCFLGSL